MDVKLVNQQKDKVMFVLKGASPAYANTLRRLIMMETPTMAVKSVTFSTNTSAMYDEMIAHRLGLVVLKTDLQGYERIEKCKCEGKGCARCSVELSLQAEGPCTVYAEMLKSKDPKIKPVFPKTIIAKLGKNQSLALEAKAVLGIGKVHVKHSPGLVYYQGYPKITVDPKADTSAAVRVCPRKVFKLEGKKAVVDNLMACNLSMACVDALPDAITVEGSDKDFVMYMESWGQLTPKEMIDQAMDVMDEKLDAFAKALKSAK